MTATELYLPANAEAPVLPSNIEAEQGLLGALLYDNRLIDRLPDGFLADHFFVPVHGRIFGEIMGAFLESRTADPRTIKFAFADDPDLGEVGGTEYLAEIAANAITGGAVADYAKAIMDMALRRELIDVFERGLSATRRFDAKAPSPARIVEHLDSEIIRLTSNSQDRAKVRTAAESVDAVIARAEQAMKNKSPIIGLPTGLNELDDAIGGFEPSKLYVVAGRPGMGKSVLGLSNFAFASACIGKPGLIISSEMDAEEVTSRWLANLMDLPTQAISRGQIGEENWQRLIDCQRQVQKMPVHIDDEPHQTPSRMLRTAKRYRQRHKIEYVIIDHLNRLYPDDHMQRAGEVAQIGSIVKGCKNMAKTLNIPVILLAQLNRNCEMREDKRPMQSDLRATGDIEQEADVIMFVYRDEYYLEKHTVVQRANESDTDFHAREGRHLDALHASRGKAEIIIAKQRGGREKTVHCGWSGRRLIFTDQPPARGGL